MCLFHALQFVRCYYVEEKLANRHEAGTTGVTKVSVSEFHIASHLLCSASGEVTNSLPMSITWASYIAASVLTGH